MDVYDKLYLTIPEASAYLGLSASSIYKMTSQKTIPHYKPSGSKILFKKTELDQWIEKGRIKTIEEDVKAILSNEREVQS